MPCAPCRIRKATGARLSNLAPGTRMDGKSACGPSNTSGSISARANARPGASLRSRIHYEDAGFALADGGGQQTQGPDVIEHAGGLHLEPVDLRLGSMP